MIRAISLALGLSVAATQVSAADSVFWKSVGNWDVSIDNSVGQGCFASATWKSGTFLRIGLNPQADNFYLLIGNDKWSSLRAGQEYDIKIRFDNRAGWDVSANGFQFTDGGTVYLHAASTKDEFIKEFMRLSRMKISFQGKDIDTLRLTGSSRAFKEVLACQDAADKRNESADPFAGANTTTSEAKPATPNAGRKSADPFAD